MKGRIVTGPERAQEQARRATRTMRKRVFEGERAPRGIVETSVAARRAVLAAREPRTWWGRVKAWFRERFGQGTT